MRRLVTYALVGMLLLCGCTASAGPSGDRTAEPQRPPVVFLLGDSYTSGIRGVPPEQTYAGVAARQLGWQVVIGGYAGTGFVQRGRIGKSFVQLDDEQFGWRPAPDMMIISGGHNDVVFSPDTVTQATRSLVMKVEQRWPKTHVVLMGPLWGGDPVPRALSVRDAVKGVAAELDVPFIDPLQGGWIHGNTYHGTGNAPQLIRKDGTHPNQAGNLHIAARVVAELKALGLDQPRLGRAAKPSRAAAELATGQPSAPTETEGAPVEGGPTSPAPRTRPKGDSTPRPDRGDPSAKPIRPDAGSDGEPQP